MRKPLLFAVMGGALALTVRGEVQAVAPMLGVAFGAVLAGVFALSTLLALNYVIDGTGSVRRWAWMVLLLAGGMELGLNTWHALTSVVRDEHGRPVLDAAGNTQPSLPALAAVAVGAGPVLLAGLLSHLVSLTMTTPAADSDPMPPPSPAVVPVESQRAASRPPARALPSADTTEPIPQSKPTEQTTATASGVEAEPGAQWDPELWKRAVDTARAYHAERGSHVRVDDIQALGIGRNRAVALRRDVLAYLLSHPVA